MTAAASAGPGAFARLWSHRRLLVQLVRRDVSGRYKGSFGGAAWAVMTPMLMLAVYLFVFGVVFNPRRAATGAAPLSAADLSSFGISLFCGMLVHGLFSECLARAPAVIGGQPAYVKRIVFPLEILPLSQVLANAIGHLLSLLVQFPVLAFLLWLAHSRFAAALPVFFFWVLWQTLFNFGLTAFVGDRNRVW